MTSKQPRHAAAQQESSDDEWGSAQEEGEEDYMASKTFSPPPIPSHRPVSANRTPRSDSALQHKGDSLAQNAPDYISLKRISALTLSFPPHERYCPQISAAIDGRSFVLFAPACTQDVPKMLPRNEFDFTFKMPRTDCGIVKAVMAENGFAEVHPHSSLFNVQWTGCGLKSESLSHLAEFQKVNHFPQSFEITRKDRLYHNVHRCQQLFGQRHFGFVPTTYILPKEHGAFLREWSKDKSAAWIIKPASLSRGRGIRLVTHPDQIVPNEAMVICRYLTNPLLVDGFKFDLRLYVAVTSFDPLRIYLYEEGLARFATAKFDMSKSKLDNLFVHLTNYSVNKKSENYVSSPDVNIEDYGNKWSLSALLQHLHSTGIDTRMLMMRIEDLIVKTIISGEEPIARAAKSSVPFSSNCIELFGFDVLIDADLKPWLIEVNLSPSLACEAPLDFKIKSHLVADLMSLGLVIAKNPTKEYEAHRTQMRILRHERRKFTSASSGSAPSVSSSDKAMLKQAVLELDIARHGGFQCIFPSATSWEDYGAFLQDASLRNLRLAEYFFGRNSVLGRLHVSFDERFARYSSTLNSRVLIPSSPRSSVDAASRSGTEPKSLTRDTRLTLFDLAESLGVLEVRTAFSLYLECVRVRMLEEGSARGPVLNDALLAEKSEQIELILRFLQRAAVHLPAQSFEVAWPRVQMILPRRQLMLAEKLSEFLRVYSLETTRIADLLGQSPRAEFLESVQSADETTLEKVLTEYTRRNKSPDVFLGKMPDIPRPVRAEATPVAAFQIQNVDDVLERLKRLYRS